VGILCVCLCVLKFCKQDISKTNIWTFAKISSKHPCTLPWKWLTFGATEFDNSYMGNNSQFRKAQTPLVRLVVYRCGLLCISVGLLWIVVNCCRIVVHCCRFVVDCCRIVVDFCEFIVQQIYNKSTINRNKWSFASSESQSSDCQSWRLISTSPCAPVFTLGCLLTRFVFWRCSNTTFILIP